MRTRREILDELAERTEDESVTVHQQNYLTTAQILLVLLDIREL
jgi:hypothetical protein